MTNNTKILLVEDEIIAQVVTREHLRQLGFAIDVASSGKEALDLVKNNSYLLVLIDLGLPDTDGFELTKVIHESGFDKAIPIIALTAHEEAGYKDKVKQYGLSGFYTKPFTPEMAKEIFEKFNIR